MQPPNTIKNFNNASFIIILHELLVNLLVLKENSH